MLIFTSPRIDPDTKPPLPAQSTAAGPGSRSLPRQLKNLGISIALDDFGTGYSSVNYLTVFPFDKIKIDKSFTQGVLNRRDCRAIVASTLALAQGLGTVTTAEGVETEEQFDYLRAAGVDLVQGYLFGRPVPIAQLDLHDAKLPNEVLALPAAVSG